MKYHLWKGLSWRAVGTLVTMVLVWAFTGNMSLALGIGLLEAAIKFGLFYGHERLWQRRSRGRFGVVLWFTGLSGAGKTTIAKRVFARLQRKGFPVEWLDGDVTREFLPQTGFTKEERDGNVLKAGFIASMLARNGIYVIASYISPYEAARRRVRNLCQNFVEVYISTPLEECERRDVKGLYAKARKGEIQKFTGIDDPYEPPSQPEIEIDTTRFTIDEACDKIMSYLGV